MAEVHLGRSAPPSFMEILSHLEQPNMVIIAGGLDDFESRVSEKYAQAIGANAHVWLIEDAWHVSGPVVVPEEYASKDAGIL